MTSSATEPSTLGDPANGGALFTLPRELRDKIYKLVVNEKRFTYTPPMGERDFLWLPNQGRGFGILQVSKIISQEAVDALYSEYVFTYAINFSLADITALAAYITNRMQNVEFDIFGLSDAYSPRQDRIDAACDAVLKDFAGADIVRKHMLIRIWGSGRDIFQKLSTSILEKIKEWVGFRTLVIEIVPVRVVDEESRRQRKRTGISMIQQILDILRPALGPAEDTDFEDVVRAVLHPYGYLTNSMK